MNYFFRTLIGLLSTTIFLFSCSSNTNGPSGTSSSYFEVNLDGQKWSAGGCGLPVTANVDNRDSAYDVMVMQATKCLSLQTFGLHIDSLVIGESYDLSDPFECSIIYSIPNSPVIVYEAISGYIRLNNYRAADSTGNTVRTGFAELEFEGVLRNFENGDSIVMTGGRARGIDLFD